MRGSRPGLLRARMGGAVKYFCGHLETEEGNRFRFLLDRDCGYAEEGICPWGVCCDHAELAAVQPIDPADHWARRRAQRTPSRESALV